MRGTQINTIITSVSEIIFWLGIKYCGSPRELSPGLPPARKLLIMTVIIDGA